MFVIKYIDSRFFVADDGLISKMVTPVTINVDEPLEVNLNLEKEKESLVIKDEHSNGKSSPHHDDEDIIFPERYKLVSIIPF